MTQDRTSGKRRGLGLLASMALVGALLVPLSVAITATASSAGDSYCTETTVPPGVTQGERDVCCAEDIIIEGGVAQGGEDIGVACCPDGTFGHWQWGGYAGQNLSYCDAPAYEPPATAPAPSVSPATAAPKKAAAAAKPTFTG